LPLISKDPGSFTIPVAIGVLSEDNDLLVLGESINECLWL